ncbi:glycosyltransferase family 2 protein [Microvirga tunisiensis]|nr:glycosyltransferase family 2 protein [Microvirga tunisiensis]
MSTGTGTSASSTPMISVIIPCYNYGRYVGEAIQSVIDQDYARKEVIVVDDGSIDDSWDIICKFKKSVRALRVPNGGPLKACLAGFDIATGEYVYILDADDKLIGSNALSTAAAALAERPSKLQFPLLPVNESGEPIGLAFPRFKEGYSTQQMTEEIFIGGCYLSPPTSGNIFRRDVFALTREVDYEVAQDGVAYLVSPFLGDVVTLDRPLAFYRVHQFNLSMTTHLSVERFKRERSRFRDRLEHLRRILPPEFSCKIPVADSLYFSYETLALERVAEGRRPNPRLLLSAVRALFRENKSPLRRLVIVSWLLSLGTSPSSLRVKVAMWKASSWHRPRLFQIMKAKLA